MIKDCFGVEVRVGDEIAYAQGSRGAQEFGTAVVTRMSAKCIFFMGQNCNHWVHENTEIRRTAGCFVVNKEKRND